MPPSMHVHLTARDGGQRLAPLAPQAMQGNAPVEPGAPARITLDSSRRFQRIEGFGAAFTEAAAVAWQALNPDERHAVLVDCFDPQRGHGYMLCRVHMNSCDFSLGHYAHVETPGDVALDSFSIERDRRALLPLIKAAQAVAPQPLQLLASPWSPPAWMKSNGTMAQGGRLLPQYADAWARCFVRFIQAYAAEGVPLRGVTVQNEPMATQRWDSCLYSAEEERDFVLDHLGPTLAGAGLGHVKIIVWTQGWIDWNLMLDETGGPNHVGNLCSAPLLVDRARSVRLPQSSYFYLGHFARFIRPGAQRILCASSAQAIECTAFVNPDGSQALVALNRSDNEQRAQVRWDGRWASMVLPPHAIAAAVRPA